MGNDELIELSRWMNGHNYVTTGEWSWINILLGQPPGNMALTQRSYDMVLAGPRTTNVIHGVGSIINNQGGVQIVAGGDVIFESDFLVELVDAIRQDAEAFQGLERSEALAAADTVARAAEGSLDQESPRFQGAMTWLRAQIGDVAIGALGSGLWAATAAVLNRLGS